MWRLRRSLVSLRDIFAFASHHPALRATFLQRKACDVAASPHIYRALLRPIPLSKIPHTESIYSFGVGSPPSARSAMSPCARW